MRAPHGGCQGLGPYGPSLSPALAHRAFERKLWAALTLSPHFLLCRRTYHLPPKASFR